MNCIIAKYPSKLFLPAMKKPYPSILDFLQMRFPNVPVKQWSTRMEKGLIFSEKGEKITIKSKYSPQTMLFYYKTANEEITIPFKEKIIHMDKNIIIVDKPHFLPVMPAGKYINENLLTRLKDKTGNKDIVPINRIDRETSGIVLFSANKKTRGMYQTLFMQKKVEKTYHAITLYNEKQNLRSEKFKKKSRIVKGDPWFRMKEISGKVNAISDFTLIKKKKGKAFFKIKPLTGKKHQIRLHLSGIGCAIINDRLYPELLPEKSPDFRNPLQLQSKLLKFTDPITKKTLEFKSSYQLSF